MNGSVKFSLFSDDKAGTQSSVDRLSEIVKEVVIIIERDEKHLF